MLTGRLPFLGESTMAVMYAHFNERPRPVAELRPDCPQNLSTGVMRMLEKDPARRWPSMDDIVAVCGRRSEEHTSELQSQSNLVCRLLLEKQKKNDVMTRQHVITVLI